MHNIWCSTSFSALAFHDSSCSCLCPNSLTYVLFYEIIRHKTSPFLATSRKQRAEVQNTIAEGSCRAARRLTAKLSGNCPRRPAFLPQSPGTCHRSPHTDPMAARTAILLYRFSRIASGVSASSDHRVLQKERVYPCISHRNNHRDVIFVPFFFFLRVRWRIQLSSRRSAISLIVLMKFFHLVSR